MSSSTAHVVRQKPRPRQLNSVSEGTATLTGEGEEKGYKEDVESGSGSGGSHSQPSLPDAETALAQGEVDGHGHNSPDQFPLAALHNPTSAREVLEHNPGGNTALVHHTHDPQSSAGQKVEISHEPPRKPAEAELRYRDDQDVLHKVTVRDVPEGKYPGIPTASSGRGKDKRRDLTGLRGVEGR